MAFLLVCARQRVPTWLTPNKDLELLSAEASHVSCYIFTAEERQCSCMTPNTGRVSKKACTGFFQTLSRSLSTEIFPLHILTTPQNQVLAIIITLCRVPWVVLVSPQHGGNLGDSQHKYRIQICECLPSLLKYYTAEWRKYTLVIFKIYIAKH